MLCDCWLIFPVYDNVVVVWLLWYVCSDQLSPWVPFLSDWCSKKLNKTSAGSQLPWFNTIRNFLQWFLTILAFLHHFILCNYSGENHSCIHTFIVKLWCANNQVRRFLQKRKFCLKIYFQVIGSQDILEPYFKKNSLAKFLWVGR